MDSSGKPVVLITGANTGLGLAIVKALCQSTTAYQILVGSRDMHKGGDAVNIIKTEVPDTASTLSVLQVDIASDESIQKAFEHVKYKYGRVDILVNNAGINCDPEVRAGTVTEREAWNKTWNVNVSGTQILTEAFIPLMLDSHDPRLIFMASGSSSLTESEVTDNAFPMLERLNAAPAAGWPKDPNARGFTAYRSCKTGLNMLMREWCRLLRNDRVKVWAVSPGFLATGLGGVGAELLRKIGAKDPSEGGKLVCDVIQGKRDHEQGKVIRANMVQPW